MIASVLWSGGKNVAPATAGKARPVSGHSVRRVGALRCRCPWHQETLMSEQHNPQPAARGTADLTPAEQLVRAVLDHRTVNLVYEGLRRVVEPHLVGIHQAGEPMVAAFQTGGFSHSGDLPGWRTFITTKVESVDPREETFTPRSDGERMAAGMVEVFARA
jgi:hypothetical protein